MIRLNTKNYLKFIFLLAEALENEVDDDGDIDDGGDVGGPTTTKRVRFNLVEQHVCILIFLHIYLPLSLYSFIINGRCRIVNALIFFVVKS